jgi:hypothetical protein
VDQGEGVGGDSTVIHSKIRLETVVVLRSCLFLRFGGLGLGKGSVDVMLV